MKQDRHGNLDRPDLAFAKLVGHYFTWLGRALAGDTVAGEVRLEGFSVRFDPSGVLVIVRGLALGDVRYVVAFGRGEGLYEALRNVTTAIRKGQWKPDKYRGTY